jgi:hypothetical protein
LSEHEWDEISFLKPANQDFAAPDFQQIFDHHLKVVEQMRAHALRTQQPGNFDWEIYVHGFIVITRADWREHGVNAVHCEQDRAKWKVVQCRLPVAQLDSLYGIMEMDEYFDNLCEYYDGSTNDGPDNQGGPAPVGEWQFAVYCTGSSERNPFQVRTTACAEIPDPRGYGKFYRTGQDCLDFFTKVLPAGLIRENWPVKYASSMKNPTLNGKRELGAVKLYPSLFVHVCGDISNIEIIKMEWDHETTRSEEELMKIGRESKTTTRKCQAEMLVATLEQLARGG